MATIPDKWAGFSQKIEPTGKTCLKPNVLNSPKPARINVLPMKPIRASEIGTYLYCRRAWMYRRLGLESSNQAEMASGTLLHAQHGRKVIAAGLLGWAGWALLLVAMVLLVIYFTSQWLHS